MYQVELRNMGEFRFDARSKDGSCTVDIKGGGLTPPDMLLASLGSCVGVYVRKYADSAKLPIGSFGVRVQAELSSDAPVRFRRIEVAVDLQGALIDERRMKALLEFVHNCPVHNTLAAPPEIVITCV